MGMRMMAVPGLRVPRGRGGVTPAMTRGRPTDKVSGEGSTVPLRESPSC